MRNLELQSTLSVVSEEDGWRRKPGWRVVEARRDEEGGENNVMFRGAWMKRGKAGQQDNM